jgi:hypothetical protein
MFMPADRHSGHPTLISVPNHVDAQTITFVPCFVLCLSQLSLDCDLMMGVYILCG